MIKGRLIPKYNKNIKSKYVDKVGKRDRNSEKYLKIGIFSLTFSKSIRIADDIAFASHHMRCDVSHRMSDAMTIST